MNSTQGRFWVASRYHWEGRSGQTLPCPGTFGRRSQVAESSLSAPLSLEMLSPQGTNAQAANELGGVGGGGAEKAFGQPFSFSPFPSLFLASPMGRLIRF